MSKKKSAFPLVNGILMILICLTILYPFANTIARSLSDSMAITLGQVQLIPVGFQLDSYKQIMMSSSFYIAFKNTVVITVLGTLLALFVTVTSGYAFARNLKGKKFLFIIVLFTMFFSGGMVPMYLQIKNLGLYNTTWALILPGAFSAYNMILVRNFFEFLPDSVLESGSLDGCNELQLLWKIALPMSKPILATITLFVSVGYYNIFMEGIMYLDDSSLYPLQVYVRNIVFGYSLSLDQSMAENYAENAQQSMENIQSAVLMITTIPIMCVYPFLQKYFVKGIHMGAVKG